MRWIDRLKNLFTNARHEGIPAGHLTITRPLPGDTNTIPLRRSVAPVQGRLTTDRDDPRLKQIDPSTGLQEAYLVLSEDERSKGFVRPLRYSYIHSRVPGPEHPLRDLTAEEHERYDQYGYVKFEEYPEDPDSSVTGSFWTQERLDKAARGCGTVTTMGPALAETYARDPKHYGGTFCAGCHDHFPVAQFEWLDARGLPTGVVGT